LKGFLEKGFSVFFDYLTMAHGDSLEVPLENLCDGMLEAGFVFYKEPERAADRKPIVISKEP
jgi:hypothetical protein